MTTPETNKPLRRQITIILEIDQDGNPTEINRAFSVDEYIGRSGGIEKSPAINVDEASLAGLLPDTAATIAQLTSTKDSLQETVAAYNDAVKAVEDAEAKAVADTEAAEHRADEAIKAAEMSMTAAITEKEAALEAAKADADAKAAQVLSLQDEVKLLQARIEELTAPPTVARTYFSDLWRRASDEESAQIEAAILQLSVKERNLLNSSQYLSHDNEYYSKILAVLTQLFGEGRANALIAPSV